MVRTVQNIFLSQWRRLLGIEDSTEKILRGLTLGIFVGLLPLMGIQILFVVFLAFITRVNKISATLGVFITNPFTAIPIYALNLKVGLLISGNYHHIEKVGKIRKLRDFAELGADLLFDFLLGSFVVAAIGAILTYIIFRPILYRYHKPANSIRPSQPDGVQ